MGRTTFDWRWLVVILVVLFMLRLVNFGANPVFGILLLAGGAYITIQAGLGSWRDGGGGSLLGSPKVTYWRGQRLELPRSGASSRRMRLRAPSGTALLISILYLVLGAGFAVAAARLLLLTLLR